jgi:hypothetical protein
LVAFHVEPDLVKDGLQAEEANETVQVIESMSTYELKEKLEQDLSSLQEAFAPQIFVTFVGWKPIPPEKRIVPADGSSVCTGESCEQTFGPYNTVAIEHDMSDPDVLHLRAETTIFASEEDDANCYLARRENGIWKLHDALEEEKGGPVYQWVRISQKMPGNIG